MIKSDIIKHIIVVGVIVIVVITYIIYKNWSEGHISDFDNKIELPNLNDITFDGAIRGELTITDKGELICVSPITRKIYFMNLSEGVIVKSINIDNRFSDVNVISKDNILYIVLDNEYLYLVDYNNRELKAKYRDSKKRYYDRKMIITNDIMATSDMSSNISIIDLKNGAVIASKNIFRLKFMDIYNGILYYSVEGFNIYVVNPKTLEPIWKHDEGGSHAESNIDFYNNHVIFNNVYYTKILDAITGEKISEYRMTSGKIRVVDNTLYSVNYGENIINADIKTGNIIWIMDINTGLAIIVGDYIFTKDKDGQLLKKVDRLNGELVWKTPWVGDNFDKVMESKNYDIIQSRREKRIYLINNNTGEKLWRSTEAINDSNVLWTVYDKYLIISDGDRKISVYNINSIENS